MTNAGIIEVIDGPVAVGTEETAAKFRTGQRVEFFAEWHGRLYHGRIHAIEHRPATRTEPSQAIAVVVWDDPAGGATPIPLEAARLRPCACGRE